MAGSLEGRGIIKYSDSFFLHIWWGLWLVVMIMVCSTLGGMVIEVISASCNLRVLVPDPLRQSGSVLLSGRASLAGE